MPILSYFAVVGSVLMAMLFVADATLTKSDSPVVPTSSMVGLPKPWQPDPQIKSLAAAPAPAPDMSAAAVVAAAPKPEPAPTVAERPAPKKKHVAKRQQPRHNASRDTFAWSRNDPGPFGGGGFFGRF
jgi:hypothetical protein